MTLRSPRLALLAASLMLAVTGCKSYSTVSTKRLDYDARTPAGEIIDSTLALRKASTETLIGGYLDAAALALASLKANPADAQALLDYNFAVSRIMENVNLAGLEPWKTPIRCPGATGEWVFSIRKPPRPEWNPSHFVLRPADRFEFKGRLVKDRTVKQGVGAPLVATTRGVGPLVDDQFSQGRALYYGVTALLSIDANRRAEVILVDPLAAETVPFLGQEFPVAADFSAPIGLALAELKPRKIEIQRLFKPEEFRSSTRLARLQPYDPSRIPVLFIHGLGDSQATWAPMIERLRGDPTIRKNYQFWFFSYPTGYPYPLMAAELRKQLDSMQQRYPDEKPMVVIGHSMGGMIARALITDSGTHLWDAYFPDPPEKTPLSPDTMRLMTDSLIFKPRPEIDRVIFISASLRGSNKATGFMGRLGRKIIGTPEDLWDAGQEAIQIAKPPVDTKVVKKMPNSVDVLDPENRFLLTINELPTAKGVPYHSIIGDRGKGGNLSRTPPVSTDGIVPYWSSHIDGAVSELIVPSDHWANRNPKAIDEVRRILIEHLNAP